MISTKTIVVHCKSLIHRKESIIDQLNRNGFESYEFYTDYDADELDQETIDKYYVSGLKDEARWVEKVALWGNEALHYHPRHLNEAEISLTTKFGKIFEKLVEEDFDHCLIFEDDVLLCEDFKIRFFEYLNQTPDDWDAIYFGSGANLKPDAIVAGKLAYPKSHPASRCADSILIKKKAIVDLNKTWFPFNLVSDWELGYQHFYHNHRIYWWEPSLVVQGSESGAFKSTLR